MMTARFYGIDLLRGIAAFGIVGCHLSLTERTNFGVLCTSLCDMNVGIFAAIAGFIMSDKEGFYECCRKRVGRLFPIYIGWSLIYIVMTIVFDLLFDGGSINPRYRTLLFWGQVLLVGGASTHLWFLPCLFYAQICIKVMERLRFVWMWLALGVVLVATSCLYESWFAIYPLRLLGFLVAGKGLRMLCDQGYALVCKPHWNCVGFSILLYFVFRGMVPRFLLDLVVVVLLVPAFANIGMSKKWIKIASLLGGTSMGVYLVHPIFTKGLSVVFVRCFSSPYGAVPVVGEWILAWIMSFVFVLIALRVPMVARFVK